MTSLTLGITIGSGVLLAFCVGRDDIGAAERVLGQSFLLNLFAGLLFTVLALWQRRGLLVLSGATGEILPLALDYFTLLAGGAVLTFLFFAVIFGSTPRATTPRWAWFVRAVHCPQRHPQPGADIRSPRAPRPRRSRCRRGYHNLAGAALGGGSHVAEDASLAGAVPLPQPGPEPAAVLKVLAIGLPAAIANLLSPLRLAVPNILVAWWFLASGVAGVAVGFRIEFFSFLPALGFAAATLALVGQNLGAGRLQRVGRSWRTGMALAFATGTLLGVASVLARGPVVAAFTDDPGVVAYARSYLATIPLTFGVVSATVVAGSALQAMNRPLQALAVFVARVMLMVAAILLAAGGLAGYPDPIALWVAIMAANVATCTGAYLLLRRSFGKLLRESIIKTAGSPHGAPATAQGTD